MRERERERERERGEHFKSERRFEILNILSEVKKF